MLVRLGSLISGNIELTPRPIARMAKSADAADLKSAGRKAVGVQVPLRAPLESIDENDEPTRIGVGSEVFEGELL